MSQAKPLLGYWDIRGLGQQIRFLFHYLEEEFEEKHYHLTPQFTKDAWYAERDTLGLPFPNLPYLIDGENKVTESLAIVKYICRTRKPELLGKTEEVQIKANMVENFMYDFKNSDLVPVVYEYTDELRQKYKEVGPRKLGYLADFIQGNKWVTGNDLTYIDFFTYETLYHMTIFDSKCLNKFPSLKEYMARFEELPAIQKYMNSDSFMKAPCYSPRAVYKM